MKFDKNLYHMYENGGMKENYQKRDYTLLPWFSINETVDIMQYGANKYSRDNWMKVPAEEYIKAAFRHIILHTQGEDYDEESGFTHLAHAMCDLIYAHYNYFQSDRETDGDEGQLDLPFQSEEDDSKEETLAALKRMQDHDRMISRVLNMLSGLDVNKITQNEIDGWDR